jgi:DNA-binding FadR family transcriptional regulator
LKKAEIVADQIEQTIVGQRWEPGELFGSEVELTQRQQPVLDRNRFSLDDIHVAHAKIAEAIIARDGALARHRMMTHLEEVSATGSRRPPVRPLRGEGRPAAGREPVYEKPAEPAVS